jgi:hypothetical protein
MTHLTRERVKELKAMLDKAIEGGPKAAARSAPTSPALRLESAQHEAQTVAAESPVNAQESAATFEKIRDVSPDGKFGVRISCRSEPADPENIDPDLITAVKLVYLPSKKVVRDLQNYDGSAAHVIWSPDSNWLAFSSSSGPAVSDAYVYRRAGEDFHKFKTDGLQVDVKGDVRNQYVGPIRWVKPGVLLLEQSAILRGGGDSTIRFTATFDEKTGKVRIASKKKQ